MADGTHGHILIGQHTQNFVQLRDQTPIQSIQFDRQKQTQI